MGFNTNGLTVFYKPWFSGTPVNAVKGSINIGTGDNGKVIMNYDFVGTEGNSYTIQVAVGVGNNVAMTAVLTGKDILVTLGTDGAGAVDNAKNTATLIAAAINDLPNITAIKTGTGADSIAQAISKTNFSGGKFATPCNASSALIVLNDTIYFTDKPCSKYTQDAWYSCVATLI